ncbi:ATP-dependent endonuclease [Chryseobacterium lactis]|uniref:ATP-dependent endonuclease n=1 Tax=Chryseobacterium lactis TaxID=1241981 RepID=A0A3G6RJ25_CHRLC|nr:AAA family ATPase [Chryseobacterium lactis]AZA84427.1 ATP-dependent endonuclease [Chryseobacterium lactis]AZB04815.1 ATP-dependent endonuclease [Chryseobacterium lactis]PNW14546.1 ATP-dependent endonuclease [Chryseobacterium lactis]
MKIISFGVNNFRGISGGIEKNTIEFNNSNTIFLLGQNNVGKSSFLKAYDFFYRNSSPTLEDIHRMDTNNVIEFEMVFQLDEYDFQKDSIKNKKEGLKKWLNEKNYLKIKRIIKVKNVSKIAFETENQTWNYYSSQWEVKNYGGIGLDSVFQAALPKPIFIKAMPTEAEGETIINEILKQKASAKLEDKDRQELKDAQSKIQELQDKLYNPSSIKAYKKEVNKYFQLLFPNSKIELSEKDKTKWTENSIGKSFAIHFEHNNSGGEKDETIPTSYDRIGHGAVRSAIFSLLLMKDVAEEFERTDNRKDYIVLFEEPELFLHPKLMKQLRTLIYKVSEADSPYQVLCASHSPQMIDITKEKSSLVRMVKDTEGTKLFQINDEFLKESKNLKTKEQLKQEMNEVLRFNPFICESFYADEVILIEGPTEEIILRGYFNEVQTDKDIFVVNCGTVNNIPFFQRIFSQFNITYHVICDTDSAEILEMDENNFIQFESGIQMTIYQQIKADYKKENYKCGLFQVNIPTFEPFHQNEDILQNLRYKEYTKTNGKPFNANLYWKEVLQPNLNIKEINEVPIIKFLGNILSH